MRKTSKYNVAAPTEHFAEILTLYIVRVQKEKKWQFRKKRLMPRQPWDAAPALQRFHRLLLLDNEWLTSFPGHSQIVFCQYSKQVVE